MPMFLRQLHIFFFKNIEELKLDFSKRIVVFIGNNAVGKTNILDAVYYLSMTKSYFAATDAQNIQHGKDSFVLYGKYENSGNVYEVSCGVKKTEGKQILWNQKPYQKISEHIGKVPVVMIAPQDLNLITEYADTRRKFLDALISKFDKTYLNALIQYNQSLQNRNSIVKQGEAAFRQADLLDVYNAQMAQYGEIILNKRQMFFNEIKEMLMQTYRELQDNMEVLELRYVSSVQNDFFKELQQSLPKDVRLGYTSVGTHRDDFDILLNGYPTKNYASQGQQKTIVFALKWLELQYLQGKTGIKPLLLIDDIYDRLDESRLKKIQSLIEEKWAGQVFITDTHHERISRLFGKENTEIFILPQTKQV